MMEGHAMSGKHERGTGRTDTGRRLRKPADRFGPIDVPDVHLAAVGANGQVRALDVGHTLCLVPGQRPGCYARHSSGRVRLLTRCIQPTDVISSPWLGNWWSSVTYGRACARARRVSTREASGRSGAWATHLARVGVPQVDRACEADGQKVGGGPVDEVEVKIVLTMEPMP